MGFLKGLGLAIIGFLLFLSLLLLGAGVTVNFTALNPGFINGQIESLDVAGLVRDEVIANSPATEMPQALREFLDTELPEFSEDLKTAVTGAVDRFYDYLLGRTETLDLRVALGETVLAPELIYSLADKIDWPDLAEELVRREIADDIDPTFSYLVDYIDDAMVKLEPWFRETLREVVPPLQQYLLGQSDTLNIAIPLTEPAIVLYDTLLEVYNRFPPPELAGLTPAQRQTAFNAFFFFELAPSFPTAVEIDSTFFAGAPESLNKAFIELKADVDRLKEYTTYYWMAFYGLILFVLLLIGLVYLIKRSVNKLLFFIGIIFFSFGLLGFAGVMAANSTIPGIDFGDVPAAIRVWLPGVVESATRPFLFFSIGAGVLGIAGIIGSILLHPHQSAT